MVGLSPDQETALFRITQEALTNALKHSGALEITVSLEDTDGGVCLTISVSPWDIPMRAVFIFSDAPFSVRLKCQ